LVLFVEIIRNYQMQNSNIQRIAIHWLQRTVIKRYRPDRSDYLHWYAMRYIRYCIYELVFNVIVCVLEV
jgi:hypothetical protein